MVELFNPYEYAFHEDPYPTYARLRAEAPVYRNEQFDFWALSRHADILQAFRDVGSYSNAYGVSLDPAAFGPDAHKTMSFLALREDEAEADPAKAICAACPVSTVCLEHALSVREKEGIWGGATEKERRRMLRQRRQSA